MKIQSSWRSAVWSVRFHQYSEIGNNYGFLAVQLRDRFLYLIDTNLGYIKFGYHEWNF